MKIYAISDLHLSTSCDKPMDIFGGNWEGYTEKIIENWKSKITDDDLVLIAGDISWAMRLEETKTDRNGADRYFKANSGDASVVENSLREMNADYLIIESDISDENAVKEILIAIRVELRFYRTHT